MTSLEENFHAAMHSIYQTALDHGYHASYFKRMLDEHGGVEAAHRLLAGPETQSGLFRLWELDLLDSSVEALVIQERFRPLFSEEEISRAYLRLVELDYIS
jgi:hypothetical protein